MPDSPKEVRYLRRETRNFGGQGVQSMKRHMEK